MFERYTEKARRVIFFARYEASAFGASQIETEHILLGLIREDRDLIERFFHAPQAGVASIRKEIEERRAPHAQVSTEIDMPLSGEAKRALAFAAEESDLLGNRHIGTEHLLLGLLREENSIAAEIMSEHGLRLSDIRDELAQFAGARQKPARDQTTRRLLLDATQPADPDELWVDGLSDTCIDVGVFTVEELMTELAEVQALRNFGPEAEALLRMLAAKGLADPQRLPELALDLCDEKKLAEFIEKLRQK